MFKKWKSREMTDLPPRTHVTTGYLHIRRNKSPGPSAYQWAAVFLPNFIINGQLGIFLLTILFQHCIPLLSCYATNVGGINTFQLFPSDLIYSILFFDLVNYNFFCFFYFCKIHLTGIVTFTFHHCFIVLW